MTHWENNLYPSTVLHWNYQGFTEFPLDQLRRDEREITDIYLKENLISRLPGDIGRLVSLESLYLSGNDIRDLPREIGMLSCLKCLDLSGNRLSRLPPEIGDMSNLKYLILDDNELCEIPLRISELKMLRYLSVCDNKLRWLPQRPVYNYHHCELRFWRNRELRAIPYSLWYHMLREQQTRSINIGCLGLDKTRFPSKNSCQLDIQHLLPSTAKDDGSKLLDIDIPLAYKDVRSLDKNSPPKLIELSKRKLYQILYDTAKMLSDQKYSIYAESVTSLNYDDDNGNILSNSSSVSDIEDDFENFNLDEDVRIIVENNNNIAFKVHPTISKKLTDKCSNTVLNKHVTPADIIRSHFDYLPCHLTKDLSDGPISRCENTICNKPIFDSVTFHFCIGVILLIDRLEDVILSAAFCSKRCADAWSAGRLDLVPWKLGASFESLHR